MGKNFFQINITDEQVGYANQIVNYSLLHHPVKDIFHNDKESMLRQREFRFIGSLGEIIFADAYLLPRPTKSYGAIDGQDYGMDFKLNHNQELIIDVKTMRRDNNELYGNYVMNIPSYQLQKENSLTEYYYCLSIHLDKVVVVKNEFQKKYIASFVGYAKRDSILNNDIGCLYKKDTIRVNKNHSFQFINDTYEVEFKDLEGPIITDNIPKINGFQEKKIILE